MYLNDKFNNKYKYTTLKTNTTLAILIKNAHFVMDINENKLYIKDVWVDPSLRKNGLWKALLSKAKEFGKEYNFVVIISLGQFRRPIANKAWKSIKDKVEIQNSNSKKIDYHLFL